MSDMQMLLTILICALTSIVIRALAFLLFPSGKKPPRFVSWLGLQLPRAVMAMLVVYCLKGVSFVTGSAADWLPTLLASGITVALHVWKKQIVLSICGGTAAYMLLIRLIL